MDGVISRVVLTDAKGNVDTSQAPSIPAEFLRNLKSFDTDLFVLWSPIRQRYFIHQCTEHVTQGVPVNNGHSQLCRSSYVLACQDVDGAMVPLNDRVLNTLRKMRATSETFGGQTERGLQNYKQYSRNVGKEIEEKRETDLQDTVKHAHKSNRITWNKLWALAERHLFTSPNK